MTRTKCAYHHLQSKTNAELREMIVARNKNIKGLRSKTKKELCDILGPKPLPRRPPTKKTQHMVGKKEMQLRLELYFKADLQKFSHSNGLQLSSSLTKTAMIEKMMNHAVANQQFHAKLQSFANAEEISAAYKDPDKYCRCLGHVVAKSSDECIKRGEFKTKNCPGPKPYSACGKVRGSRECRGKQLSGLTLIEQQKLNTLLPPKKK